MNFSGSPPRSGAECGLTAERAEFLPRPVLPVLGSRDLHHVQGPPRGRPHSQGAGNAPRKASVSTAATDPPASSTARRIPSPVRRTHGNGRGEDLLLRTAARATSSLAMTSWLSPCPRPTCPAQVSGGHSPASPMVPAGGPPSGASARPGGRAAGAEAAVLHAPARARGRRPPADTRRGSRHGDVSRSAPQTAACRRGPSGSARS